MVQLKVKNFIRRTILFVLLILILYLINESEILSNVNHKMSRINFLNKTFCGKLISGKWERTISENEIKEYEKFLREKVKIWKILHENLSCSQFIKMNKFYQKSLNDNERKNPLAFSIIIYKNLYQFQVLIRTLYLRTNFHCIHIDSKASNNLFNYAHKLSTCLENVYLSRERLNISWGTFKVLEAERICQKILINKSSKWIYHITIAGSELPIQTNKNRLQILQLVPDKSRNDVSSIPQYKSRQSFRDSFPSNNLRIYKGEFHSILTRDFIQSIHSNPLALTFFSYLNGTHVPDEHFYPTLVHLSELPGGKDRGTSIYPYYQLVSHYKSWSNQPFNECQSNQYVEGVCQFNYKDLYLIEKSGRLFANKFNEDFDLISIYCWEEWFHVKQIDHQDIEKKNYIDKFPFTSRNLSRYSKISKEYEHMIKYLYRQ